MQFLLEWRADMNLTAQVIEYKDGNEKIEEQTALMWAYEQGMKFDNCWATPCLQSGPH